MTAPFSVSAISEPCVEGASAFAFVTIMIFDLIVGDLRRDFGHMLSDPMV